MPFNIGPGELLLILAIALLVIGPGRLPDVGAALGKSIREFRKASTDIQDAVNLQPRPALTPPAAPDASAALTSDERAELERLRREHAAAAGADGPSQPA
ncbi:MAG: twin-arginine translocase TatA/TatE family subunit [Candidatus Limnocylindrales bacterium]